MRHVAYNRVIWSEGLFLQPQHFQQQDRYLERYVETRCQALIANSWGLTEIEFEREHLRIGKLSLRRAAGDFPDGTPFRMPDDDPLPPRSTSIRRPRSSGVSGGAAAAGRGARGRSHGARRRAGRAPEVREMPARDATAGGSDPVTDGSWRVANAVFAGERSERGVCLPASRPHHRMPLRQTGDPRGRFIPTVLHVRACRSPGQIHYRVERPVSSAWRSSWRSRDRDRTRRRRPNSRSSCMLQTINRFEPLLAHHAAFGRSAPAELFELCVCRPPAMWRRSPRVQDGRRAFQSTTTIACAKRSSRSSTP